ncbi:MAG: arylamine N-acetyltransferase, partial [Chlorobi bacterium CHB1]|nr:arylamine N-acetyltransferase [Chlorobi bacterium CHB1]
QAHLISVPFENLDIHLGRPIALEEEALYDKIVRQRRGGFCYELNGLFAVLLRELDFEVNLLSGRVMENGKFGPEFDHLTLIVQLEQRGLADVGFGDSFREPLRLDECNDQVQHGVAYRLSHSGEQWTLRRRLPGKDWEPQYCFTLQPHRLVEFDGMCHYHQTSPASHFTQKRICTRATPEGRVTLSDMRLIITANGQRQETVLQDEDEYRHALQEHFGIDLTISKS